MATIKYREIPGMFASNRYNKLFIALPLILAVYFIAQTFLVSPATPLTNLIASSNVFPSAQLNNSPVGFELNKTDANASYVSHGLNYSLSLTQAGAVVKLGSALNKSVTSSVLQMQYLGANQNAKINGLASSGSKSHYYIGNDPSKWVNDVTRYGKVKYTEIYPGIDLVFYGNQNELEYDFIVEPGRDPDVIRLKYSGADKLLVNNNGDLIISTPVGDVVQKKPVIYQTINNKKQFISGQYTLFNLDTIGFKLGSYDHKLPLVIDPVLDYTTYIGGSDQDNGTRIAVDSSGYIYITGFTFSSDFPSGALLGSDISSFVTKLSPDGTRVIFSLYLGGSGVDRGRDIDIADNGNIFVTGETTSPDFPVLASAPQSQNNGGTDAYVTVINPDGTQLLYSSYYGGSGYDAGHGLALKNNNQVYITGETWSNNLSVTAGAYDVICGTGACVDNKNYDAFLAILDIFSNQLAYSSYIGGSGDDKGHAIAVDPVTGYAYVTGESNSPDLPRKNAVYSGLKGQIDGFLSVIDPALLQAAALKYSTFIGGSNEDVVDSITLDAQGNAYLFGYTDSTDFPVKNAFQAYLRGETDSFLAKINPLGRGTDSLIYSTFLGGSGTELAYGVAVDEFNRTYLVGTTSSNDFPVVAAFQNANAGGVDAFVATFNPEGDNLQYASYLGGSGNETGSGIAVTSDGTAYIVGDSSSPNLTLATNLIQSASTTGNETINAFIAKVSPPDDIPASSTTTDSSTSTNASNPSSGGGSVSYWLLFIMLCLFTWSFIYRARHHCQE